MMIAIIR